MKLLTNTLKPFLLVVAIFCLFATNNAKAQSYTQKLSGKIIDKETKEAISGAELIIRNSDPLIVARTDNEGGFSFDNLPQGTYYLQLKSNSRRADFSKVEIFPGKDKVVCLEFSNKNDLKKKNGGLKTKLKEAIAKL